MSLWHFAHTPDPTKSADDLLICVGQKPGLARCSIVESCAETRQARLTKSNRKTPRERNRDVRNLHRRMGFIANRGHVGGIQTRYTNYDVLEARPGCQGRSKRFRF